ncbi:MAG TPA: M56 family metallopeptidase [Vicinamibacterales bacterium]|jgi:TonB family protein
MVPIIVTYSVQIALVILAAIVLALAVRSHPATARLAYWRFVIVLCFALPLVPADLFDSQLSDAAGGVMSAVSDVVVRNADSGTERSWMPLLWILAFGMVLRAGWLAAGALQLRRLRLGSVTAHVEAEIQTLKERLAPRAELRWHPGIGQPVTFGWRRPIILLPPAVHELSTEARVAVVCHELLHVARRDWLWLWIEEAVRTVFWFHPPMRWAIGQVRLGREQTVDARVIALTGARRAYMDAIIRFSGPTPAMNLGMAFVDQRHVYLRLKALAKETIMSRTRIALTGTVLLILLVATGSSIATAVPLPQQSSLSGPDPFDGSSPAVTQTITLRFANAPLTTILNTIGSISGIRITYQKGFEDRRTDIEFRAITPGEALRQVLSAHDLTYSVVDEKTIIVVSSRLQIPGVTSPLESKPRSSTTPQAGSQPTSPVGTPRPGELTPSPKPQPLRVGREVETPPRKIFSVNPVYPKDAMDAKVQGVVLLDATIGTDGLVKGLRLVQSVPLLDQAAMDAVNLWRFEPALLNGVPVEVEMTVTINFTLR